MIIDTNVNVSRWPFRRLRCDETPALVETLRAHKVTQAWAGNLDGLFHEDIASVNARLVEECRKHGNGLLTPFGSVNPGLPDWEEDLRRCHEEHGMRGIRLHPNYHGYTLDDPAFARLLAEAAKRGLIVQLVLKMEDERTQHPLMQVPTVDARPLGGLITATRDLRLVILNGLRDLHGEPLEKLAATGRVHFDIGMLEGVDCVGRSAAEIGIDRLLFGSHLPLFYVESALLKLRESALTPAQQNALLQENAQRLLAKS